MIIDALKRKLIEYQKSQNEVGLSTLRLLISELKYKEISLKGENKELTPDDEIRVIRKQIKNRNESIPMYEKAGRTETAEKEKQEVKVLEDLIIEFFPNATLNNPNAR
jgi:uncharacterized protein YqeY